MSSKKSINQYMDKVKNKKFKLEKQNQNQIDDPHPQQNLTH